MKIKSTILVGALLAMGATAAAQSPEELRVYINPGHGSWTGNDRPNQVIGKEKYSSTNTDTTGFFETNTNLYKGFGVLETLIKHGMPFDRTLNQTGERWEIGAAKDLSQNIVMSRVKNGPYEANNTTSSDNYMLYNRSLPEIAAEVEYNEFDMFISIHSNAASEASTTNYHLYMYRGKNGKQNVAVPGSWEMIEAGAKYSQANGHASWSHSNTYINGDIDFMGSGKGSTNSLGYYGYLGVMKHGCPGYLVEGYFHTYQPARHRGMNFDVDFEEGVAYARGVADYFEFDADHRPGTGDLYGIVRDEHQKFTHALYQPRANSDDVYMPLNGVKVNLYKDGAKIKEYMTDNFYNGAYVFFDLEPGEYTVDFEHPDYKPLAKPQSVTVVANNCVYPKSYLENKSWETPQDLLYNYPDPVGDKTAYGASDEYALTHKYSGKAVSELAGKTIRRSITKNGRSYTLAFDSANEPTIIVYDIEGGKVLANVSTQGMEGNQLRCSDIQLTADGVLLACNQEKVQYSNDYVNEGETRGTLRLYRWANDLEGVPSGDPEQFATSQNSGLWYRANAGYTFSFHGTLEEGSATVATPNFTAPNHQMRTVELTIANGAKVSESVHKPLNTDGTYPYMPDMGEGYRFVVSPLEDTDVWVLTPKKGIMEMSNKTTDQPTNIKGQSKAPVPADVMGASAFKYAGHTYLAIPTANAANAAGMELLDVTDGIGAARGITLSGTQAGAAAKATGDGIDGGTGHVVAGHAVAVRDKSTNMVNEAYINFHTVRDGAVTYFTTRATAQPVSVPPLASGHAAKGSGNVYELSFDASFDAADAVAQLTSREDGDVYTVEMGAVKAGANTFTVDPANLKEGHTYDWTVTLTGSAVANSAVFYRNAAGSYKSNSRGAVVVVKDPESAAFGSIVTSGGYAQGVTVYTPSMEAGERTLPQGQKWITAKVNSPYRGAEFDGKVVFVDWSDGGAGYWLVDPADLSSTTNLLGGVNDGTGAHIYNGTNLGGGATSVAFSKQGDKVYRYAFEEDFPTGNGTMTLTRMDITAGNPWLTAPQAWGGIDAKHLMTGTNVELVALPDGLFVSQARANGKNIKDEPAFVYLDNEGNVKFNSGTLGDMLTSCGSGIALTDDLKTMAISECKTGIGIWDVEWKDNVPSLTKRYIIPGSEGDDEVSQMAFDNAGNLYAWHRSDVGLKAYALRNASPVTTTAAPAAMAVKGGTNAVDDIVVDGGDDNAPVEYYTLGGVRVQGTPAPGLYIKRQGRTVTKVLVK